MIRFVLTALVCVAALALLAAGSRADRTHTPSAAAPTANSQTAHRDPHDPSEVSSPVSHAPNSAGIAAAGSGSVAAAAAPAREGALSDARYGIKMPIVTPTMRRYTLIRRVLYFSGLIYNFLLLWLILKLRISPKFRTVAERAIEAVKIPSFRDFVIKYPRVQGLASLLRTLGEVLVYYVLFAALVMIATAPLDVYSDFVVDHQYGLSDQSFFGWILDQLKGFAVGVFTAAPVLALVYWLVTRYRSRWPVILWAVSIPLIAAAIFAQPLIVDPIFNKFTPLTAGTLRDHIHALAVQAGIPNAPILVSDVSKQTNTTNAYVNGIGSSARIVLWDTLLKGKNAMPDRQILTIVGHEMGHYVLKHIYWGFLEAVAGLFFALPLLRACYVALLDRFGNRWGLRGEGDIAAIPALLLTFSVLSFFANPVVNALSRRVEHQADEYGLRVTHDPIGMAQAFVALSEQNLSDPNPPRLLSFWFGTHPTLKDRIEFALSKCPEYGCVLAVNSAGSPEAGDTRTSQPSRQE